MYTTIYLDAINERKLRKCQALCCLKWGRVGLRGKTGEYCPHPEDRKRDNRCESKGASRDHLERKRRDLTLARTQHAATPGKLEKRKPLTYADFASPCNAAQRQTAHSYEQVSGSSPLVGSPCRWAEVNLTDSCPKAARQ
jgi:hypothetical protein